MSLEFLLLIKVFISVSIVLLLSFIAESVSSKWAGIISGLPTGSAILLYFYAFENGLSFASESALYNMIGLVAMQSFIYGYYISSKLLNQPGIIASTAVGLSFYLIASVLISYVPVTPILALLISSMSFYIFIRAFKDIEVVNVKDKVVLNNKILLTRALISGTIIVSITMIAYLIGPKWSGIFSAFPTTLYPLIVILHMNYGKDFVNSVIKHVPQGLGGLLIYSCVIHISYDKSTGINTGVLLAFLGTVIYLFVFSLVERLIKTKTKASP